MRSPAFSAVTWHSLAFPSDPVLFFPARFFFLNWSRFRAFPCVLLLGVHWRSLAFPSVPLCSLVPFPGAAFPGGVLRWSLAFPACWRCLVLPVVACHSLSLPGALWHLVALFPSANRLLALNALPGSPWRLLALFSGAPRRLLLLSTA